MVWHASVLSKLHFGFWSIFVLLGKLQVMGYPNNMLLLCKVWFWILCDEHELGIFFISLYEIVNEWFLSHKFFCPTLSRLIFSGSDILTYRNIFCLANFGVKPHQRHADFYTKVIVKNWADFETFLFSLLDIQKSFLTIRNIKTQPKKANYKNWGMALNGQTTVECPFEVVCYKTITKPLV